MREHGKTMKDEKDGDAGDAAHDDENGEDTGNMINTTIAKTTETEYDEDLQYG